MNSERSCHSQGLEITSNNLPLLLISSLENSDLHPPQSFSPHFLPLSTLPPLTWLPSYIQVTEWSTRKPSPPGLLNWSTLKPSLPEAEQLVYPEAPSSSGHTTLRNAQTRAGTLEAPKPVFNRGKTIYSCRDCLMLHHFTSPSCPQNKQRGRLNRVYYLERSQGGKSHDDSIVLKK